VRLYAISYDDAEALSEFAEKQEIPYPLLSDQDSAVIRRYGILNTRVEPGDALLYGIPYPGAFVIDEDGVVVARSFHDTYKKRDSPEMLIDAALGRIELSPDAPSASGGEESVRLTATVHGGRGTLRQGIVRQLVVRFELGPGLHVYGEPVPEGMVPTSVTLHGPPGLVALDPILPPTTPLRLESLGIELPVWSGRVDIAVPFYPTGELASEVRPLDRDSVRLEVRVRYQACDDEVCHLPRTEVFELELPLDVIDVPKIPLHAGHGQREGRYDGRRSLRRLMLRKLREHPLGFLRFIGKTLRLEREARARARADTDA
jgi:hypothetical protein